MRFEPGCRLDHFEILEPLGEGAYAETYRARDTDSGRIVVLKCPNPALIADPQLFARYRREAEVVSRLAHPNVVSGLDDGDHRSEPYIVLEYIEGRSLRRVLQDAGGRIPVTTAEDYGRQIASALAYLHAHGIVHRDLKPENVIVSDGGTLRLMDFGTASLEGTRRLTWRHLSESLGTPDYMSPEQIQGHRGDARSDIYAWGIMMYEMLTGQVPFEGDNWMAVMAGHLQRDPERIRRRRPEVPSGLESVVLRAMRRAPENRYPSADALLVDLGRLDALDPASFDLGPEPPLGGMSAAGSERRLWLFVAAIAGGFVAAVVVILVLVAVLK